MRRGSFLLALTALALLLPARASAHANFVRTDPPDRAVLTSAPRRIEVLFDDSVRVGPANKAVRNGDGSILDGKPRTRGRVLILPLRSGIGDGDYTVRWSVVSDDGHQLEGVLAFAVGAGRAPPVATLRASNALAPDMLVSRWLFFLGVLAAGGLALFDLLVARGAAPRPGLLAIAFVLVFIGAEGLEHASHASGTTRFGVVMTAAAVLAAVGAAAGAIGIVDRKPIPLAEAAAVVLLAAPTLAGHALDPGRSWVDVPIDLVHVVAASFWFGGIAALALAADGLPLARRFSPLALGAVVAIAVTGLGRALAELESVSQLWSTGYGRAIAIKSILLALLVGAAYLSRSALGTAWARVRKSVRGELAFLLGVVGAVGVLTALPPGNRHARAAVVVPPRAVATQPPLPRPNELVLAQQSGPNGVTLAVQRADGRSRVSVVFIGSSGEGVTMPSVRIGGRATTRCGPGCYVATLPDSPTTIDVERPGHRNVFLVPKTFRSAGTLVAGATRTFHSQRSVAYHETLSSGLGVTVVTDWRLEKPNRFNYRIRNGSEAIVIGNRRWDRTRPGAKWVRSPQAPVSQPVPLWWQGRITNAYVLGETPRTIEASFLDRDGPAWFTVTFDRRTLMPRQVRMVATAHFMHQTFQPAKNVSIRPPR